MIKACSAIPISKLTPSWSLSRAGGQWLLVTRRNSSQLSLPRCTPSQTTTRCQQKGFSTDLSRNDKAADGQSPSVNGVSESSLSASVWPGIHPTILAQLKINYPGITSPTPAQRALFLCILGGTDVYLKDDMGRGKTLAIALIALSLIIERPHHTSRMKTTTPKSRVLILCPTLHLTNQILSNLKSLCPPGNQSDDASLFHAVSIGEETLPDTPIIISTPQNFPKDHTRLPKFNYIFCDEPDTMLGSAVPSRQSSPSSWSSSIDRKAWANLSPRHMPPIVEIMHRLLDIRPVRNGNEMTRTKNDAISLDFSSRRSEVETIWTSATLSNQTRRFIKNNGWVRRGDRLVDLDYTASASAKQVSVRRQIDAFQGSPFTNVIDHASVRSPEHYAFTVSGIGGLVPLEVGSDQSVPLRNNGTSSPVRGTIPDVLLEAVALLHATSPPPPGSLAILLPPEQISLDQLGHTLEGLHLNTIRLESSLINAEQSATLASLPGSPLLLANRSSMPGLHLPNLHTIYLLSGLDMAGVTPAQKRDGGVASRMKMYDIIAGRLGRLGSRLSSIASSGGDVGQDDDNVAAVLRQRIISLVMEGSIEERGLRDLFAVGRNAQSPESGQVSEMRRQLTAWKGNL